MNKVISLTIFIVIAAAIIFGGAWYANKLSEQSAQSQVAQGNAAEQAAQAQAQQQQQLMQNLKITDVTVGTGTLAVAGDTVGVLYRAPSTTVRCLTLRRSMATLHSASCSARGG